MSVFNLDVMTQGLECGDDLLGDLDGVDLKWVDGVDLHCLLNVGPDGLGIAD